jgi:hypothetical protein
MEKHAVPTVAPAAATTLPAPIVEFLFARYGRWLADAERIAGNRLRETKNEGEGRNRWLISTTARSRGGINLDPRYSDIRRATGALIEAEMARRQGETRRTIERVSQALGEIETAGADIPEHSAITLLAYAAAARDAISAGDVERLAAADYLLEHEASALSARTTRLLTMATQRRQQGRARAGQRRDHAEHHRKRYRELWKKHGPGTAKVWAAERIAEECREQGRKCANRTVLDHLKRV